MWPEKTAHTVEFSICKGNTEKEEISVEGNTAPSVVLHLESSILTVMRGTSLPDAAGPKHKKTPQVHTVERKIEKIDLIDSPISITHTHTGSVRKNGVI